MLPNPQAFGGMIDGQDINLYTLQMGDIQCAITNYGARLVSLIVPDAAGVPTDVALGYPSLKEYASEPEDYMGAIVGRCANRIAGGHFRLNGHDYDLPKNNGANTLHGGIKGLQGRAWKVQQAMESSLTLTYHSPDGEEGFPGNLDITVTYRLEAPATLIIEYSAITDAPTPVNLSNHTYWNLSGEGSATIEDHILQIAAQQYTPVNTELIPTGELAPTGGTPFYFSAPTAIGAHLSDAHDQLIYGKGYDHNWVLDAGSDDAAAILSSPQTGITLQLFTDQPGLQFYSGNFLDGSRSGKSGRPYPFRSALVLEPQHFPDSVHQPLFPSVILAPGVTYASRSKYVFTKTASTGEAAY